MSFSRKAAQKRRLSIYAKQGNVGAIHELPLHFLVLRNAYSCMGKLFSILIASISSAGLKPKI
jgi:hypothetical protein